MTDAAGGTDAGEPSGRSRRLVRTGGAVGAAVALTWVGGHVGFLGGIALLATLLAATPRYAFAVGQVGLVAAAGTIGSGGFLDAVAGPGWGALVAAELLLFGVLLTPDAGRPFDARLAAGTTAATAGLCAVAWATLTATDATWIVAVTVLAAAGAIAYGVHRYELVATGTVRAAGGGDS